MNAVVGGRGQQDNVFACREGVSIFLSFGHNSLALAFVAAST